MHPPRKKKKTSFCYGFLSLSTSGAREISVLVRLDEKICRADGLGKWPMESIPNHQWQLRLSWDFTVSHGIPSIFHGNCSWDFIDFTIQQICGGFHEGSFPLVSLLRCILIHRKSHEVRIPNKLKEQGWFSHSVRIVHTGHQHVLMCCNITMTRTKSLIRWHVETAQVWLHSKHVLFLCPRKICLEMSGTYCKIEIPWLYQILN